MCVTAVMRVICVFARPCLGSIPHRLCLTGCPCRVNKTNLRSGLALGVGGWVGAGCLQEWRAHQAWRTYTYAHKCTQIFEMFAPHFLSYSRIHIHGTHTSLMDKAKSSPGKTPINITSFFGEGHTRTHVLPHVRTNTHIQLESESIYTEVSTTI